MSRFFKKLFFILGILFALIGLLFTGVFVAMQFDLLNVRGSIEERNAFFTNGLHWGANLATPLAVPAVVHAPCTTSGATSCAWNETPEWIAVRGGLEKDADIIRRVARETGVSERLIAAVVIPEQIRFFTAEREVFKRYFEPLKILGSLSQFSLGVSGIKQETAAKIEAAVHDPASPFYPGDFAAPLIAYPEGANHTTALYTRLTDPDDHYYSYLYTALYLREIIEQWKRAGYAISREPEILVTLFNLGFEHSRPNPTPQAAGASIETGGRTYPFGILGGLFYHSTELRDRFPS